jgi:hypothetical protein
MPLQRNAIAIAFWEYVARYPLVPFSQPISPGVTQLGAPRGWLLVPQFQRGISWDADENVVAFLGTSSVFLGNIVLSQSQTPPHWQYFPHGTYPHYVELIDGLQRFAMGTALLNILYPLVLSPTPTRPTDAPHFHPITAYVGNFQPIFNHNDYELRHHPRLAIRGQYNRFAQQLSKLVDDQLAPLKVAAFAAQVTNLFTQREVAVDTYFNLTQMDILNAFLGVNTGRVELSSVDVVRAHILRQAERAGWPAADMEVVENEFTDCFMDQDKPSESLLPFVNALRKLIDNGQAARVFPSWNAGFVRHDVDRLLDFIDQFDASVGNNMFLTEIAACGALPLGIVLAWYYIDLVHGAGIQPAFFNGNPGCDADLHQLLRAVYRTVLQGRVGRIGSFLEDILTGVNVQPLAAIADDISRAFIGRGLVQQVDRAWLVATLNSVDRNKAKRVYNAMLLPGRNLLGAAFAPLVFARRRGTFHIDHLIPESLLIPNMAGEGEGATIRNLAPLPANLNTAAKNTPCSTKLVPGGLYDVHVRGGGTFHPYCDWLVNGAGVQAVDLDQQSLLQPNSQPDVGTQRIDRIADELLPRL